LSTLITAKAISVPSALTNTIITQENANSSSILVGSPEAENISSMTPSPVILSDKKSIRIDKRLSQNKEKMAFQEIHSSLKPQSQ
jgi:hypothetical protein